MLGDLLLALGLGFWRRGWGDYSGAKGGDCVSVNTDWCSLSSTERRNGGEGEGDSSGDSGEEGDSGGDGDPGENKQCGILKVPDHVQDAGSHCEPLSEIGRDGVVGEGGGGFCL